MLGGQFTTDSPAVKQFDDLGSFPDIRALEARNPHVPLLQFLKDTSQVPIIDYLDSVHNRLNRIR